MIGTLFLTCKKPADHEAPAKGSGDLYGPSLREDKCQARLVGEEDL